MEMQSCRCGPKLPIGPELELGKVLRKRQGMQTTAGKDAGHHHMYLEQGRDKKWRQEWKEAEFRDCKEWPVQQAKAEWIQPQIALVSSQGVL